MGRVAAGALVGGGCNGRDMANLGEPDSEPPIADEHDEAARLQAVISDAGALEWKAVLRDRNDVRLVTLTGRTLADGTAEVTAKAPRMGSARYRFVDGHVFVQHDRWPEAARNCWANVSDEADILRHLPSNLDPSAALMALRPIRLGSSGVVGGVPADVAAGLFPRGVFRPLQKSEKSEPGEVDVGFEEHHDGVRFRVALLWVVGAYGNTGQVAEKLLKLPDVMLDVTMRPSADDAPVAVPEPGIVFEVGQQLRRPCPASV